MKLKLSLLLVLVFTLLFGFIGGGKVLADQVNLSGYVYDPAGSPAPGVTVQVYDLVNYPTTTTDSNGYYSVNAANPGSFIVKFSGHSYVSNLSDLPETFSLSIPDYDLSVDSVLNITIPTKRVDIHVQDAQGNSIPNVHLATDATANSCGGLDLGGGILGAGGSNYYNTGIQTDTSGNATMWLIPNTSTPYCSSYLYNISANPPGDGMYSPLVLNNVDISSDQSLPITLQFVHNPPVTTLNLANFKDPQGNYLNPATVTITGVADTGFSIANTYYTFDGGPRMTYVAPFTVSGPGNHTIGYWSVDNFGIPELPNSINFTIVDNAPPVINTIPNATLNEGDTYSATGSFSDQYSTSWTGKVDYGDGSGVYNLPISGTNFSLNHVYKDNSNVSYQIMIMITDNQGVMGRGVTMVTVKNVNPVVGTLNVNTVAPIAVNTLLSASAAFTDLGTLDTHTAVFDWGDGATSSGTVTETNGSGSVAGTHIYKVSGVYTVKLTVTDKDGGVGTSQYQYVVVYDPSAGFVIGAGLYKSPVGSVTALPNVTGTAVFGVDAKYLTGKTVPTGETLFAFGDGKLIFASTSYNWLTVSGNTAFLSGKGILNGKSGYSFLVSVVDGSPDKFRMKITDPTGIIVYDNQKGASDMTTPVESISGGQIKVH